MTTTSRYDQRTRGVTLRVLDLTPVLADIAEPGPGETVRAGFDPYATVEHDGHLYVVCNEGVGWEVTDDDPLPVDLYVSAPTGFGIFPRWEVTLTPADVHRLATDDEVDLADLIRSFGARLESNFWAWHRTLTA